ncbi:unnamed protein product, partial [Prorocentrum cordatum]
MQKQIDRLLARDKPPQQQPAAGNASSGLSYKDVLVFLKEKKFEDSVVQAISQKQAQDQVEHPPTVQTARWRVEGLRKKIEKQEQLQRKLEERRKQLLEEEATITTTLDELRKELSVAEKVYSRVHAIAINDVVKVTSAALEPSVLDNEQAKSALAVLQKLQKEALDLKGGARADGAEIAAADGDGDDIDMELLEDGDLEQRTE